jgi:ABC-type spermidine/putrescine transport system permease subunit II
MVFGARPLRTLWRSPCPASWPAVLGALLVSLILGVDKFEISFYNLGAVPTLPTVAWGTLRHGIEPELYALALWSTLPSSSSCSSSTSCSAPACCAWARPRTDAARLGDPVGIAVGSS